MQRLHAALAEFDAAPISTLHALCSRILADHPFAAGLHFAAACPAAHILEYSVGANPMIHDLVEERFTVEDGLLAIPDRPGLGITVRDDFVRRYAVA